jgi:pyrroloquinoline quinone (PQQ) biosynthesis protein C
MSTHQPTEYAEEAQRRWGDTEQYRESARRTASYTEQDWAQIKAAGADLDRRLAEALASGVEPDSPAAMDLAEEHRQQISRWYYDCSYEMHRGLGQMYVADPRFTERYEAIAPGLAQYLNDAIQANAERNA